MRIAVLTATRDRLAYTQTCFKTLQRNAGCAYDHFVLDNGSTDGTREWLEREYQPTETILVNENIGINRAMNKLVDVMVKPHDGLAPYDVVVRYDNDCELTQPRTLKAVAGAAYRYQQIVAPHVLGLRNPPPSGRVTQLGGNDILDETTHLGGVFMAIPASLFLDHGFRYDETQPPWAGDELICPWWRAQGGICGYLQGWAVNHYLGTEGQWEDQPQYFARTRAEGKVAL